MTERERLRRYFLLRGVPWYLVDEAISSVALEHPEWDLDAPLISGAGRSLKQCGERP